MSQNVMVLESLLEASHGNGTSKQRDGNLRIIVSSACGLLFGVFMGITLGSFEFSLELKDIIVNSSKAGNDHHNCPRGTEDLPFGIIVPTTDLYLRRVWGDPAEDLPDEPSRYLITFTVGIKQKEIINAAVAKFPKEWTLMLFHYDGNTDDWDEFEWSKTAIHISVQKQAKWWYAKRFLHPDVVAPYDYIFIWDEDLGVEHFNAENYINIVRKHVLEISQPALGPGPTPLSWEMTRRKNDGEVHKTCKERNGKCKDPLAPPCAQFVEIMAPVFSRKAWRCVWHMIQNDLVHGWGLDTNMARCVEQALERMGVVDVEWIDHYGVETLGTNEHGDEARQNVRERSVNEWSLFENRLNAALNASAESGEQLQI